MADFVGVRELERQIGIKSYKLMELARDAAIPCLRLSKRTIKFDPDLVREALRAMQIPAKKSPKPKPAAK